MQSANGRRRPSSRLPGPNLVQSVDRLRQEYYTRWVMHPLRIDPETKMPRFSDDEGKTPLTDFFDGDAREAVQLHLGVPAGTSTSRSRDCSYPRRSRRRAFSCASR